MSATNRVRALDRAFKVVRPIAIDDFAPPPRLVAGGLWVVERRLRLPPALQLPTNMTIVRLAGGELVLHSPVRADAALLQAVRGFGEVAAIIGPNSFHYTYIEEWMEAFPRATVYTAPGLAERVPTLPASTVLTDEPPVRWSGAIEQIVYGPVGPFSEVAFRHPASRTLLLSDLAFHLIRFDNPLQKLGWRLMGVPRSFGPSRTARMTLLRDREAARPFLRRIAAWEFTRIIVGHGDIVASDGNAIFRRGFARYL